LKRLHHSPSLSIGQEILLAWQMITYFLEIFNFQAPTLTEHTFSPDPTYST